jgi:HPt (histidine-containing phosphotransfer) domain-containing protein
MASPTRTDPLPLRAEPPALAPKLADFWRQSRTMLRGELEEIETAVIAADEGRFEPELRAEARRLTHRLGGTVAMFGLEQASATAFELEREIAGRAEPSVMRLLFDSLRLSLELETGPAHDRTASAR